MYIKKIYIFFELWLTEAFGVIVEVPGLPIQPYSLIKMYYAEVKKIRQQENPIFLRPGWLKGEGIDVLSSRLSAIKSWRYRTGARFFSRCAERLKTKFGRDMSRNYSSDCIRWHLINTLHKLGFTSEETRFFSQRTKVSD